MQEGMLFHSIYEDSYAYFEQMDLEIDGRLDPVALEKAMNLQIIRHDILRTFFVYDQVEYPRQVVLTERPVKVQAFDLRNQTLKEQEEAIQQFKAKDRNKGFDLSKDTLIRLALFRLDEEKHRMIWSFHHILLDGWSLGLVLRDLFEAYRAILSGGEPNRKPSPPFSRFIRHLKRQDTSEAASFWKGLLEGYNQAVSLPSSRKRSPSKNGDSQEACFRLDAGWSRQLKELAQSRKVTMNTLFRGLWGMLLSTYNRTDDVVFGSIVSGRPSDLEKVEEMVGVLINAVPVRWTRKKDDSFLDLIDRLQEQAISSEPYQHLSLAQIQSNVGWDRSMVSHLLVYENYPVDSSIKDEHFRDKFGFEVSGFQMFDRTML